MADENCDLELLILGTGAGATQTYSREASSAFVVLRDGEPLLLCDLGYGVAAACLELAGRIPPHIYVSHNHGDHAGELPIVIAVESAAHGPRHVYAHPDVLAELITYRLRELRSTGRALDTFAAFHAVPCGCATPIGSTGLAVRPYRTRHTELCYGLVLYDRGRPVLGWTADSGFDTRLYEHLAAEAPALLVDARKKGSEEHAGFDEIVRLVTSPLCAGKALWLTGYGRQDEAPQPEDLADASVARPGIRIALATATSGPTSCGDGAKQMGGPAAGAVAATAQGGSSCTVS